MARPRKTSSSDARQAVWQLKAAGLNRAAIAAKTGLSERQVRNLLAGPAPEVPAPTERPAPVSHNPAMLVRERAHLRPPRERPRYPRHLMTLGPRTVLPDGVDLGQAILPQDIMIFLRRILDLSDREISEAVMLGVDHLRETPDSEPGAATMGIAPRDREAAARAAEEATTSRSKTWRKRHRQMTWDELRVLMLGLYEFELGPRKDK